MMCSPVGETVEQPPCSKSSVPLGQGILKSKLMRRGSGANLLEWDDSLALQNIVELVCFYVLDDVSCTRRPADFDAVDFGRGAQTKVYADITLREIASTTPDLVGLRDAARGKFDSRSDRQTVAFGPSQSQADPMTARNTVIAKKAWVRRRCLPLPHRAARR
jgi:hypothetical protein